MKQIAKKLVMVMADCAYIAKSGTNSFHGYKYATAADVLEKVNASLVKHGLAVTAQAELIDLRDVVTLKGNTERLATVKTALTIIDSESGESVSCSGIGSGQDNADKAVMKACTASLKYAWMMTLVMATGDDPEADVGVDQRMAVEPAKTNQARIVAGEEICGECGAPLTIAVAKYSKEKLGQALCIKHQKLRAQSA